MNLKGISSGCQHQCRTPPVRFTAVDESTASAARRTNGCSGLNLVFLLHIGRLFRADPHVLFLASQAGVGGPTSTAAAAASQGREDLLTPGILCALLGVIISTVVGLLGCHMLSG